MQRVISTVAISALIVLASACKKPSAPSARTGDTPEMTSTRATPAKAESATTRRVVATVEGGQDPDASPTRVGTGLGVETITRLQQPEKVLVARLRTHGAESATKKALGSVRRIGGHPIAGDKRMLGPEEARRLTDVLTDDSKYLDVVRRCRNRRWLGARFGEFGTGETVEVILGRPCDQLVFFWVHEGATRTWGSVVAASMADTFEGVVKGD